MQFLTRFLVAGLAAFVVFTQDASAQTINCNQAVTADEITVCDRRKLKALDVQLGRLYDDVLDASHRDLDYLIEEQHATWIRARNRCRTDRRCIRRHYQHRIKALSGILGQQQQQQQPQKPQKPQTPPGCTVFLDNDFRGDSVFIKPNEQMSFFGTAFDNKVSSVKISGSCQMHGFTRAFYNGRGQSYPQDTRQLGNLNDRISSVQCICR